MLSILIVPFLCYFLQVVVVSKVAILTCYLDYGVWRGLGWGHCSTRGRCGFHQSTPKKVGCGRGVARSALGCHVAPNLTIAKRSSTSSQPLPDTSPQANAPRQTLLPRQAGNAHQNANPGWCTRH
ncbi:hypothetical protein Hdeb2414_s0016g00497901 [Helianthus debilis subsp. tardiflorus]